VSELWDIPATWRWTAMGDVARVVGGSTPPTGEPSFWNGDIPWITPDDLSGYTSKYIGRGRRSLTQAGYDSCSTQLVPAGTVLFTSRAPIGYVAIAERPVCTNQGFKSFVCGTSVLPDYAFWYLRSAGELARQMASGTTFLELSGRTAARLPIPVPPIEEQRRIVAGIEELDSRLDAAVSGLGRSRAGLQRYAAAVLEAAYEQRLASTGGARWPVVPLSSVLAEPLRNGHSARHDPSGTVRVVTLTAVTQSDFSLANTKLTAADPTRVADLWLKPGDLLIERSNTPGLVGTASVYRGAEGFAIFPDLLIRARVASEVSVDFVELMLRAPSLRRYFQTAAQGTSGTMPKIDQPKVAATPVPLPDRATQDAVVGACLGLQASVSRLDNAITAALERAATLRSQVYRLAFQGRLR